MSDNSLTKTSRTIRVIHRPNGKIVMVLGVAELAGSNSNHLLQASFQLGDSYEVKGLWILVKVQYDSEPEPRSFSIFISEKYHTYALQAIAEGAPVYFTCAPSPIKSDKKTIAAIDIGDLQAVINEYGACFINIDPEFRQRIIKEFNI